MEQTQMMKLIHKNKSVMQTVTSQHCLTLKRPFHKMISRYLAHLCPRCLGNGSNGMTCFVLCKLCLFRHFFRSLIISATCSTTAHRFCQHQGDIPPQNQSHVGFIVGITEAACLPPHNWHHDSLLLGLKSFQGELCFLLATDWASTLTEHEGLQWLGTGLPLDV